MAEGPARRCLYGYQILRDCTDPCLRRPKACSSSIGPLRSASGSMRKVYSSHSMVQSSVVSSSLRRCLQGSIAPEALFRSHATVSDYVVLHLSNPLVT